MPEPAPKKWIVGWREWLALPEFGVPAIKAKVDTGARSSALHTHDYEVFGRNSSDWVRFDLRPLRSSDEILVRCEAEVTDFREVRDSGGHPETRPFVRTNVRLGELEWPIELSLTNRESMEFRMLLGRTALRDRFLVDSAASYLLGEDRSHEYGS